ncbi:hypothetical protein TBLA_0I00980 [Henningerozyma blattae CBS 6284]|uniref:alpha,alpha-trehalase n=1 Tax=Henningerozyma blattae (strain ATCC 34711 / CBS 6284 / DSM 70876 / NBRC 10599 / NRRL Y-10934 / UCD 77-7) TaxID=1071380 RepID=I2H8Q5_HENB6|nr:hypothetical protein TBLA_0I00980 [Tetrapisispora blattae CBS 6284]CCH62757.1 hypothetical protein TBLA_0I00980 [Tetrapisispora blattae CBS 6284]
MENTRRTDMPSDRDISNIQSGDDKSNIEMLDLHHCDDLSITDNIQKNDLHEQGATTSQPNRSDDIEANEYTLFDIMDHSEEDNNGDSQENSDDQENDDETAPFTHSGGNNNNNEDDDGDDNNNKKITNKNNTNSIINSNSHFHTWSGIKRSIPSLALFAFLMCCVLILMTSTLLHGSSTSFSTFKKNMFNWRHNNGVANSFLRFNHFNNGPTYNIHNTSHISLSNGNEHVLEYNPQYRKASKKLYELLSDFDTAFYDDNNMVLGTDKFSQENTYSRQPYVSNGYIGARLPNIGFGFSLDTFNPWTPDSKNIPDSLNNGWPLRNRRFTGAYVSDFYSIQKSLNSTNFPELDEKGYSTVISTIPQWTNLQFSIEFNNRIHWFNPQMVKDEDITNYKQNLSMKNGVVTTEMDYLDSLVHIKSDVWTHRRMYPLGVLNVEITLNTEKLNYNNNNNNNNNRNSNDEEYNSDEQVILTVYDTLDMETSFRTFLQTSGIEEDNNAIFMVVHPDNIPYSNAAIYSTCSAHYGNSNGWRTPKKDFAFKKNFSSIGNDDNGEKISQYTKVNLSKYNKKLIINKYSAIISSEFNSNEQKSNLEMAKEIALASKGNYESLLKSHTEAWAELYNDAFIEIPSDSLLEMTARSSLFHILSNTRKYNVSEERGLPVPVGGLSSDSYGGMVFWDADIWMQPAVLPFFPNIAKQMSNYRNATHQQALLNAKEHGHPGALYPWTSGRFANCSSTGPCYDYEYHINVDVAMASFSIYMNGGEGIDDDYLRYTTWPLVRDAAIFFASFVQFNQTIGKYETYNLTDPDEFANFVNNGAFTNAGIKTLLKWATDIGNHLGEFVDPRWMEISHNIYIPRSTSNITLEYSGMNSSVEVKQADVILMVYPLGYLNDESILNNAIRDLYYYSEKQSASGPAMTYPVFVAAAATLLNHGSSSQSYLYKSVLPYLRAPFAQFSEQSDDNFLTNGLTQPAFPFLTANGGFLQSILFGLTGIRYTYEVDQETKQIYRVLRFNPTELPRLPGGIAIRNFKYMNQVLDIIIDDNNGTIVHKSGDTPIMIKIPDRSLIHDRDVEPYRGINKTNNLPVEDINNSIQVDDHVEILQNGSYYILNPKEELKLPLFKLKLNVKGNIVENKQITNLTEGVPGDVAVSALDGNNYTHWQPMDKYRPARLLIDLGKDNQQEIKSGMILWGGRPAKNFSISILPHSDQIERILEKVSDRLESTEGSEKSRTIQELLEDIGDVKDTSMEGCQNSDEDRCTNDLESILQWTLDDLDNILSNLPQLKLLNRKFITILKDHEVIPSEPFFPEIIEQSLIEILPSNKTYFHIDYSKIKIGSNGKSLEDNEEDRKARFIVLTVNGVFDDDNDSKGATIKEIVLKNDDTEFIDI